jgi:hypothetical protein
VLRLACASRNEKPCQLKRFEAFFSMEHELVGPFRDMHMPVKSVIPLCDVHTIEPRHEFRRGDEEQCVFRPTFKGEETLVRRFEELLLMGMKGIPKPDLPSPLVGF